MIKGVNKQVLEITESENGFFEKAIFFVRPEYAGLSEGKLREHAQNELCTTGKPPKKRKAVRGFSVSRLMIPAAFLAVGVIIGLVMGKM